MNTSNGFQEDEPIPYIKFCQTDFSKKGVSGVPKDENA